jgi:hypothetical protein
LKGGEYNVLRENYGAGVKGVSEQDRIQEKEVIRREVRPILLSDITLKFFGDDLLPFDIRELPLASTKL